MLAVEKVVVGYGARTHGQPAVRPGKHKLAAAVLIFYIYLIAELGQTQPCKRLKEIKALKHLVTVIVPPFAQNYAQGVFPHAQRGGYIVHYILYALVKGGKARL